VKAVIGLGATGLSCIRYLLETGNEVIAMDQAESPAGYQNLLQQFPEVRVILGRLDQNILEQAQEIIVSPGVPIKQPAIQQAISRGKSVIGDIELFAREIDKPIYTVTGSNGKTTVTTLVGEMAKASKKNIAVAGNIGVPVLDLLETDNEGFILELSSFQLEATFSLKPEAAVLLNVTPDHMDRYADFADYLRAKQHIYTDCHHPIVNADAPQIWSNLNLSPQKISFSVQNQNADYYLERNNDKVYLACRGEKLLDVEAMPLRGHHHWQNSLAALALGETMNLSMPNMLAVLTSFKGLPHRVQLVRTRNGVQWYNDSKGTNVGATETAVNSLGAQKNGKLILLAGGLAKGADLSLLQPCVSRYVDHAILFGQDAPLLAVALNNSTQVHLVDSLIEGVKLSDQLSKANDIILLSPACASMDMFINYVDRGNQFIAAVEAL